MWLLVAEKLELYVPTKYLLLKLKRVMLSCRLIALDSSYVSHNFCLSTGIPGICSSVLLLHQLTLLGPLGTCHP